MENILRGKTILILGGTGFIGHALVEEILKYKPHSIRLFSRDEVKHYRANEKFRDYKDEYGREVIRNFLGDIRDYDRVSKATKGADIVIHAAALKRVDLMEYNVEESIKTNIFGSLNVIRACLENNVERVIFVSTDKACSPINTYGGCKFVSERAFIESNYSKGSSRTKFIVVRYGNVLESTGSVIPFFIQKIKEGKRIPITDERMTRFIISSKEAVDLIFKAMRFGMGGEVFVPKIPSMRIPDLVEVLKEKFGASNETEVVGIRAGEKIHELMINETEIPNTFDFEDIYVIAPFIKRESSWSHTIKGEGAYRINPVVTLMKEYTSRDFVISKERLRELLNEKIKIL